MLIVGVVVLGIAVAWIWHGSLAARELANIAAKSACARGRVQFLDGTVAFAGLALGRPLSFPLRILRTYLFDYSDDGHRRSQGFVIVAAGRIEAIGLAPRSPH